MATRIDGPIDLPARIHATHPPRQQRGRIGLLIEAAAFVALWATVVLAGGPLESPIAVLCFTVAVLIFARWLVRYIWGPIT